MEHRGRSVVVVKITCQVQTSWAILVVFFCLSMFRDDQEKSRERLRDTVRITVDVIKKHGRVQNKIIDSRLRQKKQWRSERNSRQWLNTYVPFREEELSSSFLLFEISRIIDSSWILIRMNILSSFYHSLLQFEHWVPSSVYGYSFILFVFLFIFCIAQKIGKRTRHLSKVWWPQSQGCFPDFRCVHVGRKRWMCFSICLSFS